MEEHFLALIRRDKKGALPALARLGLWTLSVPYGWATSGRNWLFEHGWKETCKVAVPVVSIGNLTVGGTGKTPCVEYVARLYRNLGLKVAVLSRGYGAERGRNDEALVLEENMPDVPHLQGADRVALAETAIEELESEVLILDDGFQHRRLRRDLDVVLIDATNPWGHGYMFPRGLLRERPKGLRRASAILLTRCDLALPHELDNLRNQVQRLAPNVPIAEATHAPSAWVNAANETTPLDRLLTKELAVFCGIGNPEGFRRTLTNLGMNVVNWRTYPDHHAYTRADIESLESWAQQLPRDTILATTQKDLVKIRLTKLGGHPVWALKIQLQVAQGKDVFEAKLKEIVSRH